MRSTAYHTLLVLAWLAGTAWLGVANTRLTHQRDDARRMLSQWVTEREYLSFRVCDEERRAVLAK